MTDALTAAAGGWLDRLAGPAAVVGLAVSGGSDSTALLHLAHRWAQARGRRLAVATVDHGLRAEAAAEIAQVAENCAALGHPHTVLRWQGAQPGPNLQARARAARYALLAEWAAAAGIDTVALGHTRDDLAETVLLRLARGSGVDGLAGPARLRAHRGIRFIRPLIDLRRAALRQWLAARGIGWAEDPSNDDPTHARTLARQALAALAPLGIDAEGLAKTAARMARASVALARTAQAALDRHGRLTALGEVELGPRFADAPAEIRRRVLSAAVLWIVPGDYPPRAARLLAAADRASAGARCTLGGVVFEPAAGGLRLRREAARTGAPITAAAAARGALWDNRWRLRGNIPPDATIAALGQDWPEGLARPGGGLRARLAATPAVRRAGRLIAAPLVAPGGPVVADTVPQAPAIAHRAFVD